MPVAGRSRPKRPSRKASTVTATTMATSRQHTDRTGEWTVRYTWQVPEDREHATTTQTTHRSETAAVDAAVTVLDSQQPDAPLKVIRAEVRGPGGDWRTVEWRPWP